MSIERVQQRLSDIIQRFEPTAPVPGAGAVPARGGAAGAAGETPGHFRAPRFHEQLNELIHREARAQGVAPELVSAVVQAESGGKATAKSQAGALGLMQLMPGTARALGVNPLDPEQNVRGGVRYLKEMGARFGDLDLALAAYNAGPGAVERYGGVPPFRETQDYVRKIRRMLEAAKPAQ